jgi:RimJ/RimL family protein N-acetyltransferase
VPVRVEPVTAEWAELLAQGDDPFSERFGVRVEADWCGFPEVRGYLLEFSHGGGTPEWGPHLFFDDDGALVGNGGWKGDPIDGVAELGYAVAPSHQGRGIATQAVRTLIERARQRDLVTVVAHTLAEQTASTVVLERCGFSRVEELDDDEVGRIWRWELALPTS